MNHAHRSEPPPTLAELLTAAAFGALFLLVAVTIYDLLCIFLAWGTPP